MTTYTFVHGKPHHACEMQTSHKCATFLSTSLYAHARTHTCIGAGHLPLNFIIAGLLELPQGHHIILHIELPHRLCIPCKRLHRASDVCLCKNCAGYPLEIRLSTRTFVSELSPMHGQAFHTKYGHMAHSARNALARAGASQCKALEHSSMMPVSCEIQRAIGKGSFTPFWPLSLQSLPALR